jgi:hypothetical protein
MASSVDDVIAWLKPLLNFLNMPGLFFNSIKDFHFPEKMHASVDS